MDFQKGNQLKNKRKKGNRNLQEDFTMTRRLPEIVKEISLGH